MRLMAHAVCDHALQSDAVDGCGAGLLRGGSARRGG